MKLYFYVIIWFWNTVFLSNLIGCSWRTMLLKKLYYVYSIPKAQKKWYRIHSKPRNKNTTAIAIRIHLVITKIWKELFPGISMQQDGRKSRSFNWMFDEINPFYECGEEKFRRKNLRNEKRESLDSIVKHSSVFSANKDEVPGQVFIDSDDIGNLRK